MVLLEPVELLDHHRAGGKRVGVLVWESTRQENLGKARFRSCRLARILSGGNNKVVNYVFSALDALNRDAAATSIAEEEAAGFRKQRRIGGVGYTAAQEQQQGSCYGKGCTHGKLLTDMPPTLQQSSGTVRAG
jgi:hypothetical protein